MRQSYGLMRLIRVAQLMRAPRSPPQVGSFSNSGSRQVCPMYSDAVQTEVPSVPAAL